MESLVKLVQTPFLHIEQKSHPEKEMQPEAWGPAFCKRGSGIKKKGFEFER